METIFERNLNILQKFDVVLYDGINEYEYEPDGTGNIAIEKAADGSKILKICKDNNVWYMGSRYCPEKAGAIWAKSQGKIEKTTVITIFGLGSGIYLRELMKQAPESALFIIYEPDVNVLMKALHEIEFTFMDDRVFITVEGINDELFEFYFNKFIAFSNISVCKFLYHPNYFACFNKEAGNYAEMIKRRLLVQEAYQNVDVYFASYYFDNMLHNIKYIADASVLDQLQNKVGDVIPERFPAIIVSAGPSLKKNIKELENIKNKAFIFATDTALKALLNHDIIPDAFCTVDARKSIRKFSDDRIDNIPMIAVESAHDIVLEKHKGKKIFANDGTGYGSYIYPELGYAYQSINGGGSVATYAYGIAKFMGFKKIILVGQDLAYAGNQRHYEEGLGGYVLKDPENNKLFLKVKDIHGEDVITSQDFKLYLDWFEQEIKIDTDIEVIDATEGGAKIHGSKIASLKDTIEEHCVSEFDMEHFFKTLPKLLDESKRKEAVCLIKKIPEELESIKKAAEKGVEHYNDMLLELKKSECDTKKLLFCKDKIAEIVEKIEKNKTYMWIESKTKEVEYMVLSNLGMEEENEMANVDEIIKRGIIYMDAIRNSAAEVVPLAAEMVDSIQ